MALVIRTPRDVLGVARATASWAFDTAVFVVVLPVRVATVLTDVEQLVARITDVAAEAAAAAAEVRRIVEGAAGVIAEAGSTVDRAGRVTDGAERTVEGAAQAISRADTTVADAARTIVEAAHATQALMTLLDTWRPIAEQAAPLAGRFFQEFSEEELQATLRAVDQLPALTTHLKNDVMPLLASLDRAGPDVHELLDVAKDVREAIAGIPGFTFLRKRGEHRID